MIKQNLVVVEISGREEMQEWFCCFAVSLFQAVSSSLDDNSEAATVLSHAQQLASEDDLSIYKVCRSCKE